MKAQNRIFRNALLVLPLIILSACHKDEPVIPKDEFKGDTLVTTDEFEEYEGEIGILLNARNVARKGYEPSQAYIQVEAMNGDYSQTIPINEYSYMGHLLIPVSELDEAAEQELISGVQVYVTLKNSEDEVILAETDLGIISFQPGPDPITVNAFELPETEEASTIDLNPNTSYYLQKVNEDGTPLTMAMRWNQNPNYGNVMTVSTNETFAGNQPDFVFNFIPVEDEKNTFHIKIEATGEYVISSLAFVIPNFPPIATFHDAPVNSKTNELSQLSQEQLDKFKFKIVKISEGVYQLQDYRGLTVMEAPGVGLTFNHSKKKDVYWRIVSKDISWTIKSIATDIISPVLPQAATSFSFNSTLRNCGTGDLQQTVGSDFSEQRSNTVGWEESISMTNSSSQSISATVGVEFDAKFFGSGATYSASLTTGFEWSQSYTSGSSNYESETITKTETYFSERTINVPPGKSSLVYDVYQFYENVRVDYVQRFRLSGIDEHGNKLSGAEIEALFRFSRFNGVVNTIEANSVVFTLRGHTVLDKYIDTQSSVEDVPADCGN